MIRSFQRSISAFILALATCSVAAGAFAQTTTPTPAPEKSSGAKSQPGAPAVPPTGTEKSTKASPSGTNPPNAGQSSSTSGTQEPGAASAAKPPHRTPPAAKSQDEFNAFQQIAGNADSAAAEKGADEFAVKFPQSDLRPLLYGNLMRRYQQANDSDKTLEMARKVLQYLPDDTMALVMSATVLAERTRENDLDRDERYTEAKRNAQKAIETVDQGFMVPANITPQEYESAKQVLLSMAHAALGMVDLSQNSDASAEQHFQRSIQLSGAQPDPLIYMRLALAQDHQRKYAEALTAARLAVRNTPANSPLQGLAQQEVDRLVKLTGAAAPASSGNPGSSVPVSGNAAPGTNPK